MNWASLAILAVVLVIFGYALGVLVRRERCSGKSDACEGCSIKRFCGKKGLDS